MNLPLPSPGQPGRPGNWPRLLANIVVAVAVIAVAGATFVLSYSGVRAVAITGGLSPQLARVFPGVFDAVLVIACVAAILLRDGRWWARAWAWFVLVVLLAAIGAIDVVHAMGYTLRHRATEGVVAAAPVAAVLVAFSLLLALLRQSRTAADSTAEPGAAKRPDAVPAIAAGAAPRPPAPPIALPRVSDGARPEVVATREEPLFASAPPPMPIAPDVSEVPEAVKASQPVETPQALETVETRHAPTADNEAVGAETQWPTVSPRQAPPAIRYASSALNQQDDWDAGYDRQFAGQVYPDPRTEEEPVIPGFDRGSEGVPPFDAASSVTYGPSFNRVRSTPTPPAEDED